ncbi:c-type cytochrome [Yoonia sp. 208BN28-4]|uniref:c-type cytochrome n=1 Tax=Yoonia sp. 208BN28-4 TaxID=3126505 RepID=UPI0030B69F7C
MQFRKSIIASLAFCAAVAVAGFATSQETLLEDAGLPISNPDDILAVCGGDPSAGITNFEQTCAACHTLADGEAHRAGPNLYGLYGRTAGSAEGFDYSQAMIAAGEAGLVWGRDTLQPFLANPQDVVAGTPHPFMLDMVDEIYRTDLMTHVRLTTTPPPPAPEDVTVPEVVLAMAGDVPYGEYLAAECASCHVTGGASAGGVPQIDTLTRETMMLRLYQYKVGALSNRTMGSVAASLGDEEIAALAAYFAQAN